MPNSYHVRLAISQYGDKFRAELFTEDLGDTEGDLLPAGWEVLSQWLPQLRQAPADLPADAARKVGKQLFEYLLGQGENSKKWTEILDQSRRQERPVRLLIDATTDAVRDLPYGLLCDPHNNYFLLQGVQPIQFVRIVRRCTPRLLRLPQPARLLLAAAEPESADLVPFGCDRWLCQLARDLASAYDLFLCTPSGPRLVSDVVPHPREEWQPAHFTSFCRTSPELLRVALESAHFDILHLLAHGMVAGVVLCDAAGKKAVVTSGDLAKWCAAKSEQGESRLQMAFLQICHGSETADGGGFGGTAQQLLNPYGGNLAVVLASPYPLVPELSTPATARFYQRLAKGEYPDAALDRHLTETNWTWAFLELWVRPSALEATGDRGTFLFVSPYRGLGRFEERDAEIFFGREAEVQELGQLLSQEPVITVVGDPGSGKSSLLRAGLAHQVRQQGLLGCTNWRIVVLEPGREPARNLAMGLVGDEKTSPAPWAEEPTAWDQARWEQLLRSLMDQELAKGRPLLILFDQFEEMFTLNDAPAQRRAVAETLAWIADQHRNRTRIVLSMRSEYLGVATALPGHAVLLKRPWVLSPPEPEQICSIVEGPAKRYGYSFQGESQDGNDQPHQGLLSRILSDPLLKPAAAPQGDFAGLAPRAVTPLPLLEFALERLWLAAVKRGSKEFSLDDYNNLKGLGGAIAAHAEDVYQQLAVNPNLGVNSQEVAERILTGVTSSRGTRRPRTRQELRDEIKASMDAPGLEAQVEKLIDYLVGERLLTIRTDPGQSKPVQVDLIHEVLITQWGRLQQWLGQDPRSRRLREEIEKEAKNWYDQDKATRLLVLEGDRLTDASVLLQQPRSGLTDLQREYIKACASQRKKEADDERRRSKRLRNLGLVIGLLGIGAIVFGIVAFYFKGKADDNAKAANIAREKTEDILATSIVENIGGDAINNAQLLVAENKALWELARIDNNRVRFLVLEKALGSAKSANQFGSRLPFAVHAAIQLDPDRRATALREVVYPKLRDSSADSKVRICCLRIMIELSVPKEDVLEEHYELVTRAIEDTSYPFAVSDLTDILAALPGTLSETQALRVLEHLLVLMAKPFPRPDIITFEYILRKFAGTLREPTSVAVVKRLLTAANDAKPPYVALAALCEGLVAIPGTESERASLQVFNHILAKTEKSDDPATLAGLARASHVLSRKHSAVGAGKAVTSLFAGIQKSKDIFTTADLVQGIGAMGGGLAEVEAEKDAKQLFVLASRANNSLVFEKCISSLALLAHKLSGSSARELAEKLIQGIEHGNPSLKYAMSNGLKIMVEQLPDDAAVIVRDRLIAAMEATESLDQFAALAPGLTAKSIYKGLSGPDAAKVTKRFLIILKRSALEVFLRRVDWGPIFAKLDDADAGEAASRFLTILEQTLTELEKPEKRSAFINLFGIEVGELDSHAILAAPTKALGLFESNLPAVAGKLPEGSLKKVGGLLASTLRTTDSPDAVVGLAETLSQVPGSLDKEQIIDILKYPLVVGKARTALLQLLEKETGKRFGNDIWNVVAQIDQIGISRGTLLSLPVKSGNP